MRTEPAWRELPGSAILQAGTDEAGRGALAGDVVAAAVILDPAIFAEWLERLKEADAGAARSLL